MPAVVAVLAVIIAGRIDHGFPRHADSRAHFVGLAEGGGRGEGGAFDLTPSETQCPVRQAHTVTAAECRTGIDHIRKSEVRSA